MREPLPGELIDYRAVLAAAPASDIESAVAYLSAELPYVWRDAYLLMTPRPTRIQSIRLDTFDYIFDDLATLEALGEVPVSLTAEARLVGVLGTSAPPKGSRRSDDNRLKGFIGPTEEEFGVEWDKGHYMAHELGGSVAGVETNVFIQRRALNRGVSIEGKEYRAMERYCGANRDTFCFSRPLYADDTSQPSFVEFGVLKSPTEIWVRLFDNRGPSVRGQARGAQSRASSRRARR